jgi:hypothetical protein
MEKNNLTSENFTYWLWGFFEIQNPQELTAVQIQEIKNHLNLVLDKKYPIKQEYCDLIPEGPICGTPFFPEMDCSSEIKLC